MSHVVLAHLKEKLDSMDSTVPDLELQGYKSLTKNTFKVVCSHASGVFAEDAYRKAVTHAFDKKMAYIPHSIAPMSNHYQPVVSMIVQAAAESRAFDEDFMKAKRMKPVHANMFMDADDNLWKVVESAGGEKNIVQVENDNYDEIMASRMSSRVVHASTDSTVSFCNGDYVMYYHAGRNEIRAGFGLHIVGDDPRPSDVVFDRASMKVVRLPNPAQVVEAFAGSELNEAYRPRIGSYEETATLTNDMANVHIDYMRKLYSGTNYFDKLEQLIAQRKATGDLAMTTMKLT